MTGPILSYGQSGYTHSASTWPLEGWKVVTNPHDGGTSMTMAWTTTLPPREAGPKKSYTLPPRLPRWRRLLGWALLALTAAAWAVRLAL